MTTIQAGAEPRTALPGGRGVRRSELTIISVISEKLLRVTLRQNVLRIPPLDSPFSIYLCVLSPLALAAQRHWPAIELAGAESREVPAFRTASVPLLVGGLAWGRSVDVIRHSDVSRVSGRTSHSLSYSRFHADSKDSRHCPRHIYNRSCCRTNDGAGCSALALGPVCYGWASKASSMPSMNVATATNILSKYDSASRPSLYRNSSHVPILLLVGSSGKGK
jgi:hypothetical protein